MMDDEIDDALANGEVNLNDAIELGFWMNMSIVQRRDLIIDYNELGKEWQQHLDETYADWANR